jgi:DEAD/DEAH box helicase domain-containing protein
VLPHAWSRSDLPHARERWSASRPPAERLSPYRGGYLPEERRAIERRLFDGELYGVISTNALELGIDVGSLDAAVLVGFPSTIASTWQQAGRAGRKHAPALAVVVAYGDPIDQYLMRHPRYFFGQSPENAVLDPENPYVLASQLACAAYELPLSAEDEALFGGRAAAIASLLEEEGALKSLDGLRYWSSAEYPAGRVSRTISTTPSRSSIRRGTTRCSTVTRSAPGARLSRRPSTFTKGTPTSSASPT